MTKTEKTIVAFKKDKNLMPYEAANKYTDKLESRDPLYQNILYTCNKPIDINIGDIKIGETFHETPIGELIARMIGKPELGTVSIERTLNRIFYNSNDKPGRPGMPPIKPLTDYNVYYGFIAAPEGSDETMKSIDVINKAMESGMEAFEGFKSFKVSVQKDLEVDVTITNREVPIFGVPAVIVPILFSVPNYKLGTDCFAPLVESTVVEIAGVPYKIYTGFQHADTVSEFTYVAHKA